MSDEATLQAIRERLKTRRSVQQQLIERLQRMNQGLPELAGPPVELADPDARMPVTVGDHAKAFGARLTDSATLGFADELRGLSAGGNALVDNFLDKILGVNQEAQPWEAAKKAYRDTQQKTEQTIEELASKSPVADTAGDFAGSALAAIPFAGVGAAKHGKSLWKTLGKTLGIGAAEGAASALGHADPYADMIDEAIRGAVLGGGASVVLGGLVGSLANRFTNPDKAALGAYKAVYPYLQKFQHTDAEKIAIGNRLLDELQSHNQRLFGQSAADLFDILDPIRKEAGQNVGNVVQKMDSLVPEGVGSPEKIHRELAKRVFPEGVGRESPHTDERTTAILNELNKILNYEPSRTPLLASVLPEKGRGTPKRFISDEPSVGVEEFNSKFKSELGNKAFDSRDTLVKDGLKRLYGAEADFLEAELRDKLPSDLVDEWLAANKRYHELSPSVEMSKASAVKEAVNDGKEVDDVIQAALHGVSGNPGSAKWVVARSLAKKYGPYWHSSAAAVTKRLHDLLGPEMAQEVLALMGRFAALEAGELGDK